MFLISATKIALLFHSYKFFKKNMYFLSGNEGKDAMRVVHDGVYVLRTFIVRWTFIVAARRLWCL